MFPKHGNCFHNETTEVPNAYKVNPYWEMTNINTVFLNVSRELLSNGMHQLIFASNKNQRPQLTKNDEWILLKHDFVDIRHLQNEQSYCFEAPIFPSSLEQTNYIILIILSIFYVMLIFLTVYFRNDQPLKSRGIFPLMSVLFGFWTLIHYGLFHIESLEWRETYFCYVEAIGYLPSNAAEFFVFSMYCLRVVLILTLNNNKNYIRNQDGKLSFLVKMIFILKYLTSDFFMLIITVILYIFTIFRIFAFHFAIAGLNDCRKNPIYIPDFVYIAAVFAIILVYILDFFLMLKQLISCKLRNLCCTNDPFYFRSQQWIVGSFVALFAVLASSYFLVIVFLLDSISHDIQYSSLQHKMYLILQFIFSSFFYVSIFYFDGYVLSITIIQKIFSRCKKEKKEDESGSLRTALLKTLRDEEMTKGFKKFADSEWSSENYLMYFDIEMFRNMKNLEDQKEFAQQIYNTYLNGQSAPLEVNIVQNLSTNLRNRMENEKYDSRMFNSIQDELVKNLLDTFSRFAMTSWYLNHEETKELIENQL
eukprot:gene4886-8480_t